MSVLKFPVREKSKSLFGCVDCGSRSFKIVKYDDAPAGLICANCECPQEVQIEL